MKQYPKIDYAFRPEIYWSDVDPFSAILRNVKGENRRRMIHDHWRAAKLDELDSNLLSEEVDERTRNRLAKIHPSFMGGEYMPSYPPGVRSGPEATQFLFSPNFRLWSFFFQRPSSSKRSSARAEDEATSRIETRWSALGISLMPTFPPWPVSA